MKKNNIRIIKEKQSFGIVEYYYKDDKLIKKIDYTKSNPHLYRYDSNGELIGLTVIGKKSHKKLWFGIIGSLLVLAYLYNKCNSVKHNPERPIIKIHQQER